VVLVVIEFEQKVVDLLTALLLIVVGVDGDLLLDDFLPLLELGVLKHV